MPQLVASKQRFDGLIPHQDVYPLKAERTATFMTLEDALKDDFK